MIITLEILICAKFCDNFVAILLTHIRPPLLSPIRTKVVPNCSKNGPTRFFSARIALITQKHTFTSEYTATVYQYHI